VPTTEDAYEKNTKDQYEALGRFVEEFELMVNEARMACIQLCQNEENKLASIALLHQSLTAKPIFEIMRAMVAETVKMSTSMHYNERETFKSVLGQLQSEYETLANKRNDLLHGTWFIGYRGYDDDGSRFFLQRLRTSADGLIEAKELPKDAKGLTDLATRCEKVRWWIVEIDFCLGNNARITDKFLKQGKYWILKLPDGALVPLPER
jgi:hypothetical protein